MQSSNKIPRRGQTSGISRIDKLPKVLPYPILLPFDTPSIRNIFCYVVRRYDDGLAVLIYRQPEKDQVITIFGDWHGNNIDLIDSDNSLVPFALQFAKDESLALLLNTMRIINIEQAQFFFGLDGNELVLVDIQLAYNKLAGPGMVHDIFGKIFHTQEVLKTEFIDDRSIELIAKGVGSYEGNLILKPSKFRMYHDAETNAFQPLYVGVER